MWLSGDGARDWTLPLCGHMTRLRKTERKRERERERETYVQGTDVNMVQAEGGDKRQGERREVSHAAHGMLLKGGQPACLKLRVEVRFCVFMLESSAVSGGAHFVNIIKAAACVDVNIIDLLLSSVLATLCVWVLQS